MNKHVIYQNFTNFMYIEEIDINKLESVIFGPLVIFPYIIRELLNAQNGYLTQ